MSIPAETPLLSASSLLSEALTTLRGNGNAPPSKETLQQLQLSLDILTKLDPYLDAVSTPPPASLQPLIDATVAEDWDAVYAAGKTSFPLGAQFSAGAYEGVLVAQIARALKAKRVLEVGMFTGTTTLCIADHIKETQGSKVVALELDAYLKDFVSPHLKNAGLLEHVEIMTGAASASMDEFIKRVQSGAEEPFDLIFVDADKGGYKGYFDQCLDGGLLRKGGVMLVDNTLYSECEGGENKREECDCEGLGCTPRTQAHACDRTRTHARARSQTRS